MLNESKNKEPNYEQQIMIKNKEIKNKQQLIDILNRDKIKLKNSLKLLDNSGTEGGNKMNNELRERNLEIIELENKIKNYKLIISDHAQCVKKIDYLNKMIGNKKREIVATKLEISEKDSKTNELNSKINMVDKALEILEENKNKKKLKLKKKDYQLSLENEYNQTEQKQIIKNNRIQSQKYVKTIPSNNNAIKNKILTNNKNIRKNGSPSSSKNNILYSYSAEEVQKALDVFTEEERQVIMKMMNNNQERYETLIEKLVVLERFRNSQKKQIKVKIRRNKNKIEKDNESLNAVKNEIAENEKRKNELNDLIKQYDEENIEIKKRINELNKEIKGVNKTKMQNKNINTEVTNTDINNNINTEVDIDNKSNEENNKKQSTDKINEESNINNNSEINREMPSNIQLNSQQESLYKEKSKQTMDELIQNMNQINDDRNNNNNNYYINNNKKDLEEDELKNPNEIYNNDDINNANNNQEINNNDNDEENKSNISKKIQNDNINNNVNNNYANNINEKEDDGAQANFEEEEVEEEYEENKEE